MRRMSFALTTGDCLLAVDKLRTKDAEPLAVIEIVDVRREPLNAIEQEGPGATALEGLPDLTASEFVDMLCAESGKKPTDLVTRIAFRYLLFDCPTCGKCVGGCGRNANPAHANYCCSACEVTSDRLHTVECTFDCDHGYSQPELRKSRLVRDRLSIRGAS